MTTFDWVVLIWLVVLTVWLLLIRSGISTLCTLLVKAGVLKWEKGWEPKKTCPPTYQPPAPSALDDPKNNPFLKAGIEAVKEHKQQQQKQKDSQDG